MIKLTKELCIQATYGGLLLGGGGGGNIQLGFDAIEEAFRHTDAITMLTLDDMDPNDTIVNVSMLGAPSAKDTCVTADHWKTNLKNFENNYHGGKIAGFTSCENGGVSTSNGWIISALTGIPVVDAPSNGRAHPSGTMGSIGLNTLQDYKTVQSACGGKDDKYVETVATGAMNAVSHIIRQTAVAAGGMCCVLRNPVTVTYAAEHAAVGAISQAIKIGKAYLECNENCDQFIDYLKKEFDAHIYCRGIVSDYNLNMEGGYDIGSVKICQEADSYELTFWNEYMTLEKNDERTGTFPDLLCTIDAKTGLAISSAEIKNGDDVYLISIPKEKIILGAGMYQKELFKEVESLLHKDMTLCNAELFK